MTKTINKIILILGQKRMGKTSLAFELVQGKRFIFLDPKGQLDQNDLYSSEYEDTLNLNEINNFLNKKRNELVIYTKKNNYLVLFDKLKQLVNKKVKLDFWLVIDETQFFTDKYNVDENLEELIAHGSHSGLNLMFVVREAHEINKVLRSQIDDLISFRQVEPADLKWCLQIYENADVELKNLGRFEYIYLRKLQD